MNLKERLRSFMIGRYGMDQYGKFLLYTSFFMLIFTMFTHIQIIYYIALFIMIFCYFRIFSRNVYKRSAENSKFLEFRQRLKAFWTNLKERFKSGSSGNTSNGYTYTQEYKIFKCPSCRQKLRVPKGKGKIQISCRRCGNNFIKKT